MRINQPVTEAEYDIGDAQNLISRTDLRGRVTYASPSFSEVSGYRQEELVGAPHNLIRHPDMPEAAFANLWATLQAKEIWTGLVKNRRKNGDYYWVRAHVVPILEGDEVQGYTSVRVRPSQAEKRQAEAAYAALREGRGRGIGLDRGRLIRGGWAGRLWRNRPGTLRGHLLLIVALASLLVVAGEWLGPWGRGLGLGLLLISAAGCYRRIGRAVDRARRFAMQIAAGNLVAAPPPRAGDEMDGVIDTMALMRHSLANISQDIRHTLGHLKEELGEQAEDHRVLAEQARVQSERLAETAERMNTLTQSVQEGEASLTTAQRQAQRAHQVVGESETQARALVERMVQVRGSADKMNEVTRVIESIAFQTNLLALNASVEAARAGEHGRGFAVVAQQVRQLAERSSEAIESIDQLIATTQGEIKSGVAQIAQLAENNGRLFEAVAAIDALMAEVTATTRGQGDALLALNGSVASMDRQTRAQAERVGHSAELGGLLEMQLVALENAISSLRLAGCGKEWVSRERRREARQTLAQAPELGALVG
ncbi:methyl-accepting chemotaxis protein [Halomonas salifodinae]|uniref:Methyl-accepting chemotaxis protein n=1 Tax=Halomonas salifodinae TaxID=438745 RepID=A0ABW2F1B6_9GAMM